MKTMLDTRYIVVVEIENRGFIFDIFKELEKAKKQVDEVLKEAAKYSIYEMNEILGHFLFSISECYDIKGNQHYIGKCEVQVSNGVLTVSIIKIDNTFNLKHFMKERENHSIAISNKDEFKYDKLLEVFPKIDLNAN
jgi:hypothetical protein